jgi:hypothetical protein
MARVVALSAAIPARVRQAQRKPPDLSNFSSLACPSAGLYVVVVVGEIQDCSVIFLADLFELFGAQLQN